MNIICNDNIMTICNYLSIESAHAFGLTCSRHFTLYRKYICKHPTLNHFKETLIKIREREIKSLVQRNNDWNFSMSPIYEKLRDKYSKNIPTDPTDPQLQWRWQLINRPLGKSMKEWLDIPQDEQEFAYQCYCKALDTIIINTQKNRELYNELPLPVFVKYLINIWFLYPSKYLRLVPVEVLQQYLTDCDQLSADYCLLFKTMQRSCSGPHISDKENIWNLGDKIVDWNEVLVAFSRTKEDSFLFGLIDVENNGEPPLTICNSCAQSKPCSAKCRYYYIDYENRFPDSYIRKRKIGEMDHNHSYGYYEGTFLDIFNYFVKNRYLLAN